jgi:kojibiose phosphorylase
MTYRYTCIDGWLIRDEAGYHPDDEVSKATVFALANGYMGSRGAPEFCSPQVVGVIGNYVNGIYDSPTGAILDREMINLPAWNLLSLSVEGEALDLTNILDYVRTLDMRRGLMSQVFRWRTAAGITVTLESERLVSLAAPHLAAIRWQVTASQRCAVAFRVALDADTANRWAATHTATESLWADGAESRIQLTTIQEGYRVTVATTHTAPPGTVWRADQAARRVENVCELALAANRPTAIDRYVAVYDSRFTPGDDAELAAHCGATLAAALAVGYEAVRAAHADAWALRWSASDVHITGDDEAQMAIRFCLFHLLANASHDERVSISARGLQGQDYWGSIFWDCEIYALPFFIYTQPEYARRSLAYRYHTLDGARRKAKSLGFEGAYYAWQSQETGDETCERYVFDDPRTGQKIRSYFADEQIHISADVVYALWQYFSATGDDAFLWSYGLAIACEVARFFASRVTANPETGAFELRTVLGPDEYHERVNNDAYTNGLARYSLRIADRIIDRLRAADAPAAEHSLARLGVTESEIVRWRDVARRLCQQRPDDDTGLIEQFDGYFALEDVSPAVVKTRLAHPDQYPGGLTGPFQATQAIKQADVVLLLYLLRDRYSDAQKRANWAYYEPRTAHDSSLSPMAYALVAAELGMMDWAYRYFLHTALMDLVGSGPHWNLGVHTAAMGGAWLVIVHGFCRLDLTETALRLRAWPALPAQWRAVTVCVIWHGHPVQLVCEAGRITLSAEGGPVPVEYPGGRVTLEAGESITLRGPEGSEGTASL